ncbi:autotransporter outer membrane beta-barrel domain-containing protein [Entomomonas moraniae]|uniref:Autotransporter outer membrane beta-barrel domain-containing protein n=1 Tax=Entomomonas moraniae TaxID=2213226 RepID=A0A451EQ75_9GAMM|nr:autotransporter outer membrane beta-barrel domain-containing protein [Entomomonas moraniae]AZS51982.1 autotransporter outer membrane beta-barrel domain-containing protein [Entomomonas moraniae]
MDRRVGHILKWQTFLLLSCASSIALADRASCSVSADGLTNNCSGVYSLYDSSNFNYQNVVVNNTGISTGYSPDVQGFGVYVSQHSTVQNLTVNMKGGIWGGFLPTDGFGTDAIRTQGSGSLTVTGKLIVNAIGSSADGINASITSNATVNTGNNTEINAKSGVAVRSNLTQYSTGENTINIGDNATINTLGYGSNTSDSLGYALYAGSRDSGDNVLSREGSAVVTVGKDSTITTTGNNAYAVYANKTGYIQLGDNATITTSGAAAHGIVAQDGTITANGTTQSYSGGVVDLLGNTTITVDPTKNSNAIYSSGNGSVVSSSNTDRATTVAAQTSGKFNVVGNMLVDNGGKIDLRMTDGSSFIGNTAITNNNGTLNLDITGANSRWQMNDSSQLTNLDLKNNAAVVLGDQTTAVDNTNQVVLTTENLTGSGNFFMRTNIVGSGLGANNIGDLLQVTGSSQGNHVVTVSDSYNGSAAVDGTERLKIIETADGNANFALTGTGTVDVGAYQYTLNKGDSKFSENANNWYLSAKAGGGQLTNAADHSVNILNINYLLNYAETQTLLHRMGELRQPRDKDWDFWIRGFAGKMNSFSGKLSGFDMDYHGFQAGLDRRFIVDGNDLYTGIMVGTSKAKADYDVGNGDTTSYHVGLYTTYKTQNDFYVDAIAKYTVMKNDFNTTTGGGYQVNGDGKTRGYTLGLETGKRFYFDHMAKAGWYVEPQAQLTYSYQDSAKIHSSNGLKTKLDSYESILGRASGVVGYNINQGKTPVDVYFKTGYVKEFDGRTSYSFNGNSATRNKYAFDGSWWDNGIGINAKVNKQHNIYAEADFSKGSRFNNKSIKVGYRLEF